MKICIIASGYPTSKGNACVFVAKLADELANLGHNVSYVAPQSISKIFVRNDTFSPTHFVHTTKSGKVVNVFRPYIVTFGTSFLGRLANGVIIKRALLNALKKIGEVDTFYSHFWGPAHTAFEVIKSTRKPLFVATGESKITFRDRNDGFVDYINGVICVSTKNKEESEALGLIKSKKSIVLPNAIDDTQFHLLDKRECRKQLGIPQDAFVVAEVGTISNRKGQKRVSDAIKKLNDRNIYSLFLGRCIDNIPDCNNILKLGFTIHDDVPKYLNAADVYVFPSLEEGCSNSIVEAMSCGLPIISSDLPFNYDILDKSNSILVDPKNVDQIAQAIRKIKENPELAKKMSENSLKKASYLNLNNRAKKIVNFILQNI